MTRIGDAAFLYCRALKSVVIPDSVTYLGAEVFEECSSLQSVILSKSVKDIPFRTFSGCRSLTGIDLSEAVESIGNEAFDRCSSLSNIHIGDSVESIGYHAFTQCSALRSITIPDSVKSIDAWAFDYTTIYGYENSVAELYAKKRPCYFIPIYSKTDEDSGVTASVVEDNDLSVDSLEPANIVAAVQDEILAAYNITLTKDGTAVQPDNAVTVRIPCDNPDAKVYRIEADGSLTDMHAVYRDGCLVFITDHFSVYIVTKEQNSSPVLLGDADGDGKITILDATVIQRNLAKLSTAAYFEKPADADEDGKVTILDATAIQRYLAKLTTHDGIGDPMA